MINVNQITSRLASMPDQALQQYAAMHKNDPYTMALALSESNRRKQMRQGAQMQAPQQPKVVDQELAQMAQPMPEDTGIGTLPAKNLEGMAEGGIVAFEGGGEVPGYAEGVFTGLKRKYKQLKGYEFEGGAELFDKALDAEGIRDPKQRAFLKSIHAQESDQALNAPTRDKSGAMGPMQVTKGAWKDVSTKGDPLNDRADPFDNMRAGIRYASTGWQKAGGDPVLAGAYYYGGPGGFAKAQKGEGVAAAEDKGQTTLQYGKQVAARMPSLIPGISTAQAAPDIFNQIPGQTVKAPAPTTTSPEEGMSFLDKSKQAIVDAGTKGIAALGTAAPAIYEAFTPSFKPDTTVSQALKRTGAAAGPLAAVGATGAALSTGAANALSNATPEQLDQLSSDVGSDTGLAAAIMNAPNRPPEKPAMSYGDQMANIAKTIVSAPDRPRKPEPAPEPVVEPVEKGGVSDLNQAFRQFELAQQNKTEDVQVAAPKPEDEGIAKLMPEEPKKNETDWGNLALMFGLNLLAGDSPNALTNVGKAGLNTLAMQQAEAKAKSERETKTSETEYRKAMGKYYDEMAGAVARGAKEKNNVQMAEQAAVNAAKAWADANKMALLQTPGLFDQKLREFRMEAYKNFGIEPTMTASAPDAIGGGFKLLGVRPS